MTRREVDVRFGSALKGVMEDFTRSLKHILGPRFAEIDRRLTALEQQQRGLNDRGAWPRVAKAARDGKAAR